MAAQQTPRQVPLPSELNWSRLADSAAAAAEAGRGRSLPPLLIHHHHHHHHHLQWESVQQAHDAIAPRNSSHALYVRTRPDVVILKPLYLPHVARELAKQKKSAFIPVRRLWRTSAASARNCSHCERQVLMPRAHSFPPCHHGAPRSPARFRPTAVRQARRPHRDKVKEARLDHVPSHG